MIDILKGLITYGFLSAMSVYFGYRSYVTEPRGGWQWFGTIFFGLLTALWLWLAVRGVFSR